PGSPSCVRPDRPANPDAGLFHIGTSPPVRSPGRRQLRLARSETAAPRRNSPLNCNGDLRSPSYNGIENSVPGTHSLIFSSSRLIANGFAIKPATPGSLRSSCALFSSAFPDTRISGGTSLIG